MTKFLGQIWSHWTSAKKEDSEKQFCENVFCEVLQYWICIVKNFDTC